jgi:hypothetical protein
MRFVSLIVVLFALLPSRLPAAEAGDPAPEYQVELLLFLRDAQPGGEYWQTDGSAPDPALAIATVQGGPPPVAAIDSLPLAPAGPAAQLLLTSLPVSEYQLGNHAEALRRKGLTPLLHTAWQQRVGNRDNKDWLWLRAGPVYGLVRISLGRFLHIDTDLALQTGQGDNTTLIHSVDHRRMRSNELHYLDHPAFGMLVLIRPYVPASAVDEPAASEPR